MLYILLFIFLLGGALIFKLVKGILKLILIIVLVLILVGVAATNDDAPVAPAAQTEKL